MLIRVKDGIKNNDIKPSEITSEFAYLNRRKFIAAGTMAMASLAAGCSEAGEGEAEIAAETTEKGSQSLSSDAIATLSYKKSNRDLLAQGFYTHESLTPYADVTSYNNFYEFGTDKGDPKRYASALTTQPWSVAIEGEVEKPGMYQLEDIIKHQSLEERIYRLRCVEAWSMVVPWIGFPLATLIKRVAPTSRAKFVAFETLYRPEEMRGQRSAFGSIDWPYVEGLRMDEAVHPLTILAVGLYGKVLPNQNGAPLRLVVPWKYGFKSIKSITKIRFTETMPPTSWNRTAPHEYGFYSNVNPEVSHPRWSQARERRLPSSLFSPNRIDTLPFNGYAEQVASLYRGMNLRKNF